MQRSHPHALPKAEQILRRAEEHLVIWLEGDARTGQKLRSLRKQTGDTQAPPAAAKRRRRKGTHLFHSRNASFLLTKA